MSRIQQVGDKVLANVERVIVGKHHEVRLALVALMCRGHLLIEDVPGTGKTVLAKAIAKSLGCTFRRIQFTPDLLPSDVTGLSIYNQKTQEFEFRPGPVMSQVVLADEINRATPKTQSSLLECMEERQSTIDGVTHPMPDPFLVIATQNPIEYEGTFPLPEAQLDRFIMKLAVGHPDADDEQEILKRRRERRHDEVEIDQVSQAGRLLAMRETVETVHVDPDIERYIVALVSATRSDRRVAVGASPRGSLALLKLARAWAALDGRDYVLPDDVKLFAGPALAHRLILKPDLWMKLKAADEVIASVVQSVPVPVIEGV